MQWRRRSGARRTVCRPTFTQPGITARWETTPQRRRKLERYFAYRCATTGPCLSSETPICEIGTCVRRELATNRHIPSFLLCRSHEWTAAMCSRPSTSRTSFKELASGKSRWRCSMRVKKTNSEMPRMGAYGYASQTFRFTRFAARRRRRWRPFERPLKPAGWSWWRYYRDSIPLSPPFGTTPNSKPSSPTSSATWRDSVPAWPRVRRMRRSS